MTAQIIQFPRRDRAIEQRLENDIREIANSLRCEKLHQAAQFYEFCDHGHIILRAEGWRCAKCGYVYGRQGA